VVVSGLPLERRGSGTPLTGHVPGPESPAAQGADRAISRVPSRWIRTAPKDASAGGFRRGFRPVGLGADGAPRTLT